MSDFHIVLIFNEYYTQIVAVFDETDAEQKQKQTCCKPTPRGQFWFSAANVRSIRNNSVF